MAADYTRRDFGTIKEDLLRRASVVLPEWTDRDPSDFGMLFVDLWSYMGDVLHYYIDRAAREAFITTATQRESVLALANLLDYRPRGRSAARSTVFIKNNSLTTSYTLPSGTVLLGREGTTDYTCYTDVSITIGPQVTAQVVVIEGQRISEDSVDGLLGTSDGTVSQRYDLPGTNIVDGSIKTYVKEDGVTKTQYRAVPRISSAQFGSRVFSTYTTAQKKTQVVFGNNINGFIPPANSPVVATFARSSGRAGNFGTNTVVGFQSSITSDLVINSSTAFIGGSDEESIESLRSSIPVATRPQNRAVTLQDFIDLALGVNNVYKATAIYSAASSPATAASVTIYPVTIQSDYTTTTSTSASVSQEIADDIVAYIEPKALLGVNLIVNKQVTLVPINITANVYVNERYVSSWVITDVYDTLINLFSFDNVSFKQRITLSEIYKTILSVEGVDYAIIDNTIGGVFSTTASGVSSEIVVGPTSLPRKGNIVINAYGGITTGS